MLLHPTPGDLFDDIEFRWLKPRNLQLIEGRFLDSIGKPSGESFQMIAAFVEDYGGVQEYSPLQDAASLSSEFTNLAPKKAQMVAFASKWGFLARPKAAQANSQTKLRRQLFAETISSWVRSIRYFQHAVAILKWLRDGDERELKKRIVWEPESDAWKYSPGGDIDPLLFRADMSSSQENVFVQGRRVFAAYVNYHLTEYCHPLVKPIHGADKDGRFVLRVMPKNLVGLLWWQLGREALGDVNYRLCKVCKKPLEISKDDTGFRTNREFCSAVCKQRDYREKVKAAKQMYAEGRKVKDIAKQLKTTAKVVQNWLMKKK